MWPPAAFVTRMSLGCHFLFRRDFRTRFRVTVGETVTMTLTFIRQVLRLRTGFTTGGSQCHLSKNSYNILRRAKSWEASEQRPDSRSFQLEIREGSAWEPLTAKSALSGGGASSGRRKPEQVHVSPSLLTIYRSFSSSLAAIALEEGMESGASQRDQP
jgi:hypothetical protein